MQIRSTRLVAYRAKTAAFIEAKPDGFYLRDNQSNNGTFVKAAHRRRQTHSGDDIHSSQTALPRRQDRSADRRRPHRQKPADSFAIQASRHIAGHPAIFTRKPGSRKQSSATRPTGGRYFCIGSLCSPSFFIAHVISDHIEPVASPDQEMTTPTGVSSRFASLSRSFGCISNPSFGSTVRSRNFLAVSLALRGDRCLRLLLRSSLIQSSAQARPFALRQAMHRELPRCREPAAPVSARSLKKSRKASVLILWGFRVTSTYLDGSFRGGSLSFLRRSRTFLLRTRPRMAGVGGVAVFWTSRIMSPFAP